jgi:hypothetical protein
MVIAYGPTLWVPSGTLGRRRQGTTDLPGYPNGVIEAANIIQSAVY